MISLIPGYWQDSILGTWSLYAFETKMISAFTKVCAARLGAGLPCRLSERLAVRYEAPRVETRLLLRSRSWSPLHDPPARLKPLRRGVSPSSPFGRPRASHEPNIVGPSSALREGRSAATSFRRDEHRAACLPASRQEADEKTFLPA